MAFEFKLPDIGEGVVEGEIISWKVAIRVGACTISTCPIEALSIGTEFGNRFMRNSQRISFLPL